MNDAFVTSPRIDNISSVCAILEGLASAEPSNTLCIGALFDNEEIGSRSKQGADSTLLSDIVKRLAAGSQLSLIEDGFYLSVDVAHATHPNYNEKSDITNTVLLGKGAVLNQVPVNVMYVTVKLVPASLTCATQMELPCSAPSTVPACRAGRRLVRSYPPTCQCARVISVFRFLPCTLQAS